MFGKRGQEGVTLGTLILLVLGGVALVVIILGFTMGWGFIFGKIGLLPGQSLQALAESCTISANSKLTIDYCTFREIRLEGDSAKSWVNCEHPLVKEEVAKSVDAAVLGAMSCDSKDAVDKPVEAAQKKCDNLVAAKVLTLENEKTVKINDETCSAKDAVTGNLA